MDEIIRKLASEKLFDRDGHQYLPNFVRIGENYDPALKEYSLDGIAEKLCKLKKGTDPRDEYSKIINEYRLVFATLSAAGSQVI